MLWDTHMHTEFSVDSSASPVSMADEALRLGLKGICFTDHMDYDYQEEPESFILNLDEYFETMPRVRDMYSSSLPILIGIEIGLQPHLAGKHKALTESYDFDFVIGSSHVVHGVDPYYGKYYEGRGEREAYMEYFESILENIKAYNGYDVYGHIDYVVRYGPNRNANYSYQEYSDIIDEILKALIDRGRGIEINTAGFKYGLGHPNPTEDIIKRYRELGGEIITVGADAHAPSQIAWDFDKVPGILKSCGFKYYTVFKKRKPEFIKI